MVGGEEVSTRRQRDPIGEEVPARLFAGFKEKEVPADVEHGPGDAVRQTGRGLGIEVVLQEKQAPVVALSRVRKRRDPAPQGRSGYTQRFRHRACSPAIDEDEDERRDDEPSYVHRTAQEKGGYDRVYASASLAAHPPHKEPRALFSVAPEPASLPPKDELFVPACRAERGSYIPHILFKGNIALDRFAPRKYDSHCFC